MTGSRTRSWASERALLAITRSKCVPAVMAITAGTLTNTPTQRKGRRLSLAAGDHHLAVEPNRQPSRPRALLSALEIRFLNVHLNPVANRNVNRVVQQKLLRLLIQRVPGRLIWFKVRIIAKTLELLSGRSRVEVSRRLQVSIPVEDPAHVL